ncbi:S41 family peptidase [Hymenobacter cavernae]|uniref:Tail specific protease domain-containing protein n=1 Tax=Hymenobacter cavernae TaxID=2044852 RepID=A0ABQ1UGI2_9BACT|nr:S41 family peptidase [Hymenobacter cavernae]GGF18092.1 hypothetical protein GCM10011383_31960 [Hymenobacter cavernae]
MKHYLLLSATLTALAALSARAQKAVYIPYTEQQVKVEKQLWDSPAWKTPYQPQLSEDEKVAGLSKFWSEAKYNFAFFDKIPKVSWDSLYLAYIPKVKAAPTTLAYYQLLQEMCAQLHDGHTNVYPPRELMNEVYERPPLRIALIEDKVLITEVGSETLRQQGFVPGQEVLAVDGVPARTYAEARSGWQSASTPQDRTMRTYNTILAGAASKPVEVTLQDAKGRTLRKTVARSGYTDEQTRPVLEFRLLKDNVGYLALNGFDKAEVVQRFAEVYPQISQTSALIIDVRANGGGNSDYGYEVLSYLTDQPFQTSRWITRDYHPPFRPWERAPQWYSEPQESVKPKGSGVYTRPVVLLTSARTFSAAEDFAVAFDIMKRGLIIGEPTGGSTGQPLLFSLPGGGMARICTKRDTYPNGKEFVGVGVQPQVMVHPTMRDIRSGRDTILEAALKQLKLTAKR